MISFIIIDEAKRMPNEFSIIIISLIVKDQYEKPCFYMPPYITVHGAVDKHSL